MSDLGDDVAAGIGQVLYHVEQFLKEMHGVTLKTFEDGPRLTPAQWQAALDLDGAMEDLKRLTGKTGVDVE